MHVFFIGLILTVSLSDREDISPVKLFPGEAIPDTSTSTGIEEPKGNPEAENHHEEQLDTLEFRLKSVKDSKPLDITISTFEDVDINDHDD